MKPWQSIIFGLLLGCGLTAVLFIIARQPQGTPVKIKAAPTAGPSVVHITGCVANPGLYELPKSSRVQHAVQAAGGITDCADLNNINLARQIRDGEKIAIPSIISQAQPDSSSRAPIINGVPAIEPILVDINHASVIELQSLPGIGEVKANNIIAYREQYGPFETIEGIMDVPGIGETIFSQIKELITAD